MYECTLMSCSALVVHSVFLALLVAGIVPGAVFGIEALTGRGGGRRSMPRSSTGFRDDSPSLKGKTMPESDQKRAA